MLAGYAESDEAFFLDAMANSVVVVMADKLCPVCLCQKTSQSNMEIRKVYCMATCVHHTVVRNAYAMQCTGRPACPESVDLHDSMGMQRYIPNLGLQSAL